MNTITLLLTSSQIERLYAAWSEFEVKAPAYAQLSAQAGKLHDYRLPIQ